MQEYISKPDHASPAPSAEQLFNTFAVNKIGMGAIASWLRRGWQDFVANPVPSLLYGMLFAATGIIMTLIAAKNSLFVISALTGFLLVGPFLALGLYEISRRREQGEKAGFMQSLKAMSGNTVNLGVYAIALGLLMMFWVRLASVVAGVFFSNQNPGQDAGLTGLWQTVFNSPQGWTFVLAFLGIGLVFALGAFITGVVTAQLMLDRQADIVTAAGTSIRAVLKNPLVMLAWALVITVIVGAGLMTFNIGLVVAMPLIAYASWHAYRDLVVQAKA